MKIFRIIIYMLIMIFPTSGYSSDFGLIKIAVAPLREAPGHDAEMGTEAVIGTPVELHELIDGEWWRLTMPCGYRGYIHSSSIEVLGSEQADEWRDSRRLISCVPIAWLLAEGKPIEASYVPYGGLVEYMGDAGYGRIRVKLPSGASALASADNFREFAPGESGQVSADDIERVIACAKTMTGSPYLWGGTTMLAPDCSGLTQISFREAGVLLPRNASQQALVGKEVVEIENAERGDLLFFTNPAGRVDHVAIYLGDGLLIQSSRYVWEGTINPSDESELTPYYARKPAYIRRIKNAPAESINFLINNPLYFNQKPTAIAK